MNTQVWRRRDVFLLDTFFLTKPEAEAAFATGFVPGDQDSGEMTAEQFDIVTSMDSAKQLLPI